MNASLEKNASHRLLRARSALIVSQPFFGCLALQLAPVVDSAIETMATDGKSLFYNPAFVCGLAERELIGVMAHEVMHPALGHHARRGRRDPETWNRAADYAINRELIAAGFTLPKGALLDSRYDGLGAEAIYSALGGSAKPKERPQAGQEGQPQAGAADPGEGAGEQGKPGSGAPGEAGKPGEGRGGTRAPDPGGCGGVIDAAPPHDEAGLEEAATEWQAKVRQAAMIAKATGCGTMPAIVARIIGELNEPNVSWRDVLRRFADCSAHKRQSWNRPNRRFIGAGSYMPGYVADSPNHIVCVVDVSGSMNALAIRAAFSELQSVLDEGAADRVTISCCNTAVTGSWSYTAGDIIDAKPSGGGGTRFAPAFKWIADHAPDASAIVYLTDLDCRDFGPEPFAPVLWGATDGRAAKRPVPWGEIIRIDPND